jgi:hypothetical protein
MKYVIPTDDQIRASLSHNCNEHGDECDLPCISCGQIIGADGYCDDVDCPNYKNGLIAGYLNEHCACDVMGLGNEHSLMCPEPK